MKIAYFGDENSNTYLCAKQITQQSQAQLIGYTSIRDTAEAVSTDECVLAVVPVENSVEGSVHESLDVLVDLPLFIRKETVLPIRHSLVGCKGARITDVRTVYSHPQALSQCRKYLREHLPQAALQAVAYTSAGLDLLDSPDKAVIARVPRAEQVVLAEGIEDYANNETRFAVLSAKPKTAGNKVSILFSVPNCPGSLLQPLQLLKDEGCNMSKIESRPSRRKLGVYLFFVDFVFTGTAERSKEILTKLQRYTDELKFLGQYESVR